MNDAQGIGLRCQRGLGAVGKEAGFTSDQMVREATPEVVFELEPMQTAGETRR